MPSAPSHLPNFFIVGAPKAGTTSLYHYLAQHPDIYMSPIKEPSHFSTEIRSENFSEQRRPGVESALRAQHEYVEGPMTEERAGFLGMEWDDYVKLFKNVKEEKAIGEASVIYLWSKTAPENIYRTLPNAKILMVLRDPASRIFSAYLEALSAGAVRCSFREFVDSCLSCSDHKISVWWPMLELGLYYEGVKRYLDRFPRENICILLYDDYETNPARVVTEIYRFLGVDSGFTPDFSKRYHVPQVPRFPSFIRLLKKYGVWHRVGKLSPPALRSSLKRLTVQPRGRMEMSRPDREFLLGYYRDDVRNLASLLDRDLSAWLA